MKSLPNGDGGDKEQRRAFDGGQQGPCHLPPTPLRGSKPPAPAEGWSKEAQSLPLQGTDLDPGGLDLCPRARDHWAETCVSFFSLTKEQSHILFLHSQGVLGLGWATERLLLPGQEWRKAAGCGTAVNTQGL